MELKYLEKEHVWILLLCFYLNSSPFFLRRVFLPFLLFASRRFDFESLGV